MKIQILQGLNLENNHTTIKIFLDKKPNVQLIEEIKNYHPIFLKSYKAEEKALIIQSKLPGLWMSIGKILGKKDERLLAKKIIKKKIKSMSTISILDIVDKMDEEITPFLVQEEILNAPGTSGFNRQYCIGCGKRSAVTVSFSSSKDAKFAKEIQVNKQRTNKLIDRLNIPAANWEVVNSKKHLEKIFPKYKKPVVIKPTSLTAGHGVNTGIKTQDEAQKAFESTTQAIRNSKASEKKNKIIIQEQIEGEDYRLFVVNNKLMAATKRIPAFITGNGNDTIKELIEKTNKDPRRDTKSPTHILKPILIDQPLIEFLQEQKINLKYKPKKGEKIVLRKVASMSQGGITEDFTDKVHKQIKYIAEILAHSLRAYVLGIDVICKDISKPLTKENGGVIEVNTMPEGYLNMFPVLGSQRPQIATEFVKGLLGDLKTKKIVIIGGDLQSVKKKIKKLGGKTGIYSGGTIYINNEILNENISTDKAVQALKINSYLDNIVLHYKNIQEVEEYGLGFDKIDIIYLPRKLRKKIAHIDKKLIKKRVFES